VAWAESHWLDNGRVLLRLADRELSDAEITDGVRVIKAPRYTLHIWDVHSGEISRYSKDEIIGPVCVADGFVRYVVKRGSRKIIREGPFGAEREREPTPPRVSSSGDKVH